MNEKLNCSSCNAIIYTSSLKCDYCGNNYRMNGKSAELIKLKNQLDKMLINSKPREVIKSVNSSDYKDHPIIKFRLAKAEMLVCLFKDKYIESQKFCDIFNVIDLISQDTSEYKNEFIAYISLFLPSLHISLYPEDYDNILTFLRRMMLDSEKEIVQKLTEQLLISELGEKFMKEYLFYTNKKNLVNDPAFLKKKEFLELKYNNCKNELRKKNHFS